MPLLAAEDTAFLRDAFAHLQQDVTITLVAKAASRLVLPGQAVGGGDHSEELRTLLAEVAATSPRIKIEEVDAGADAARAQELAEGRTPTLVFASPGAKGKLRYFGTPAGYEMSLMVGAIADLGSTEELPDEVKQRLAALGGRAHIQVFVTPTCPHCPAMGRAAFQLAMASDKVIADVVECQEFPDLAQKYEVRGVPKTLVNGGHELLGNVGPRALLDSVEKATGAVAANQT